MSSVDNRIVEMEFDNDQFESGVATTMSTLQKFKEALKFDGATKGLEGIEETANGISFSTIEENTNKLADRFSVLGEVAMTALQNITNRAIDAGIELVKSLSIDNITAGFDKYERSLKATQTIMAATGEEIDVVQGYMDKLNWYTDETSYNYNDMADNIARFTSNGVTLDVATTAMMGVANASALAGSDIQIAGHAMEGFAKALGQGYMDQQSWKWIKTAKMDTMATKEAFIEAALEAGTLYEANGKIWAAANDEEVSAENFLAQLGQAKWLTKDVIISGLNKFGTSAEKIFEICDREGVTASYVLSHFTEYGLDMKDVAVQAFQAAQEYRTFADAIDATKDAVSTGWMKTFRFIFGNYEEAKALWSALGDTLYGIFARSGEARNEMLEAWSDMGGRDVFIEALANVGSALVYYDSEEDEFLGVFGAIKDAFTEMFPPITAETLRDITEKFRDFTKTLIPTEETLDKIRRVTLGILAPFHLLGKVIKGVIYALSPVLRLVGDFLGISLDAAATMGDFSVQITAVIEALLDGSGVFQKVHDVLDTVVTVIEKVVKGIIGIITNTGIFKSIWGWIVEKFEQAKNFLKEFKLFKDIGKSVDDFSKKVEDAADQFVEFIDKSGVIQYWGAWFKSAWESAKNFFASLGIVERLSAAWASITTWFTNAKKAVVDFFQNSEFIQKASDWLQNLGDTLKKVDLGKLLLALVAPIGLVAVGLFELGKAIVKFVEDSGLLTSIWNVIKGIGSALYDFGVKVIGHVSPYLEKFGVKFEDIVRRFKNFYTLLTNVGLGPALKYLFKDPIKWAEELHKKFQDFVAESPFLTKLKDKAEDLTRRFKNFYTLLTNVGLGPALKYLFREPIKKVEEFKKKVQDFIDTNPTIQAVIDKFQEWKTSIQAIWDSIEGETWAEKLGTIFETAQTKVSGFVDKVQEFIDTNPQIQALKTQFDEWSKSIQDWWDSIEGETWTEKVGTLYDSAKKKVDDFLASIEEFVDTNPQIQALKAQFDDWGKSIQELWDSIEGDTWAEKIGTIYDAATAKVTEFSDAVQTFLDTNPQIQAIKDTFDEWGASIQQTWDNIEGETWVEKIGTIFSTAASSVETFKNNIQEFYDTNPTVQKLKDKFEDFGNTVQNAIDYALSLKWIDDLSAAYENFKTKVEDAKNSVTTFFKENETIQGIVAFFDPVIQKVQDFIDTYGSLEGMHTLITTAIDNIQSYANTTIDFISEHGVLEWIKQSFKGLVDDLEVLGKKLRDFIIPILQDAKKKMQDLWKSVTGFEFPTIGGMIDSIKKKLSGLKSPWDLIKKIGDKIDEFLANHNLDGWKKALQPTIDFLAEGIQTIFSKLKEYDVVDVLKKLAGALIALEALRFFHNLGSFFGGLPDAISSWKKESVGSMLLKIAGAILVVAAALYVLSSIKDPEQSLFMFKKLLIGLGVMTIIVGLLSNMDLGKGAKDLSVSMILMMVAVMLMVKVLKMIEKADIGYHTITNNIEKIIVIFGMLLAMAIVGRIAGKGGAGLILVEIAIVLMLGIIKLLNKFKDTELARGIVFIGAFLAIIGIFSVIMSIASRISGENGMKGMFGYFVGLAVVLAVMSICVAALGKLDERRLIKGVAALGLMVIIMGVFSLMAAKAAGAKGSILMMAVLVAAIAASLWVLSKQDWKSLIASAGALAIVIWSVGGVIAILQHMQWNWGLIGSVVMMGLVLAEVVAALSLLNYFSPDADKNLKNAFAILVTLGGLIGIFAVSGALSAIVLEGALAAVGAVGIFFLGIEGLFVAMGELAKWAGDEAIDKGIDVVEKIGEAIATFVATLIDIIGESICGFIEDLGGSLNSFATDIEPFIDVMKTIPLDLGTKVGVLSGAIVSIIVAEWVDKYINWMDMFTGDNSLENFANRLVDFSKPFKEFCDNLDDIPTDLGSKLSNLSGGIIAIVAAEWFDKLVNWMDTFTGENSLENFAQRLVDFSETFKVFVDNLDDIVPDDLGTRLANLSGGIAAIIAAEWLDKFVNWMDQFTGENSLESFAQRLVEFSETFKVFIDNMNGLKNDLGDNLDAAAGAIITIIEAEWLDKFVNWMDRFTGENSLKSFAERLKEFSEPFSEFVKNMTDAGGDVDAINAAAAAAGSIAEFCKYTFGGLGMIPLIIGQHNLKKFGEHLADFAPSFATFCSKMAELNLTDADNEALINKAVGMAGVVAAFANDQSPKYDGVVQWFVGEENLAKFGEHLAAFAPGFVTFCEAMEGLNLSDEQTAALVKDAVAVAGVVGTFANNEAPKYDGVKQWFEGEENLATFGEHLKSFAPNFATFCEGMAEIGAVLGGADGIDGPDGTLDAVSLATTLATAISDFANATPKYDSEFMKWFEGEVNLATFGSQLADFGKGYRGYIDALKGADMDILQKSTDALGKLVPLFDVMNNFVYQGSDFAIMINEMCSIPSQITSNITADQAAALESMATFCSAVFNKADTTLSVTKIQVLGKRFGRQIRAGIEAETQETQNKVTAFADDNTGIIKWFNDILLDSVFSDMALRIINAFTGGLADNQSIATNQAETLAKAIIEAINGVFNSEETGMMSVGLNAAKGLASGLTSQAATDIIVGAGKTAGENAVKGGKLGTVENSPSRAFYDIGMYCMMGFANGITRNTDMVMTASKKSAEQTVNGFSYIAEMIAAAFDENLDISPVITPVVDLSNVMAGTQMVDAMFANSKATYVAREMKQSDDLTTAISKAVTDGLKSVQDSNPDNVNPIYINVYGAQGQDVNALADAVAAKIANVVQRRKAVYA